MNYDFLMVFWFFTLAIAWTVYICLESIVVGSGILTLFFKKDNVISKRLQASTALHQEGIEVWLIVAIGGTFAAFPLMYGTILTALYIPVYLLIVLLITRGVTLEFMYKDENPMWQKTMFTAWGVSSLLIPVVVAIFIFSMFTGLKIGAEGMEDPFYKIFSSYSIIFASIFVAAATAVGVAWAKFHTNTIEINKKIDKIALISTIIVTLGIILTFMQFNTKIGLFNKSVIFDNAVMYIFPMLTIILGASTIIFAYFKKNGLLFISMLFTQLLLVLTCFLVTFPTLLPSTVDSVFDITMKNAAAGENTLQVMFIAGIIIIPIVIFYQSWKFIKFFKK